MDRPFAAYRGDEPYVFVCYAHTDQAIVFPEISSLNEQGVHFWYDEGISAGRVWRAEIAEAIEAATTVLFYVSKASLNSAHCSREINHALDLEKNIVPVYLEDVELTADLRVGLSPVQALHRNQDPDYRQQLTSALGFGMLEAPPTNTSGGRSWYVLAGVLLALGLSFAGWWNLRETASEAETETAFNDGTRTIAVLTLRNLSPDSTQDWLAGGLSEQLRGQIGVWPQLNVIPSAVSRRWSLEEVPPDVDLVVDGYIQGRGEDVTVNLDLIEMADRSSIWSETFSGQHQDPLELQIQMAKGIARFFGESTGGIPAPPNPEAYGTFLRYINNQFYGQVDTQIALLEEILALDEGWALGWAHLGFARGRLISMTRDMSQLGPAREAFAKASSTARDQLTEVHVAYLEALMSALVEDNLDHAEQLARRFVEFGLPGLYAELMVISGLYAEAEPALTRFSVAEQNTGLWEFLAIARAHLGDAEGSVSATRHHARLWPPESVLASYMYKWALPHAGLLDEARSYSERIEDDIDRAAPGSTHYGVVAGINDALLFEIAMAEGDVERARAAAERVADAGTHGLAGILFLRLDDARAEQHLMQAADEPYYERYNWWSITIHLTPELREHPLIVEVSDAIGITKAWRLELCKRAATLPPESYITCDPAKYAFNDPSTESRVN